VRVPERVAFHGLTVLGLTEGFDVNVAFHDKLFSGRRLLDGLAAGLKQGGRTGENQGETKRMAGVHKYGVLDDAGF
jgi:hypothetical protein